jgi:hypothetical protein
MTWVAWRQQRAQIIVSLAVAALVAAGFVWLRLDLDAFLRSHGGMAGCWGRGSDCPAGATDAFSDRYNQVLSNYPFALLALPALLGAFAGAPLFAREFEQGTHVFGLTQSVSRGRWWLTKIAIAGTPVFLAMLALGLVVAWALDPADPSGNSRLAAPWFETRGLAPAAYTLMGFTVGVTAGLLLKNAVGAMALTVALYIGLLIVVANGARPFYAQPVQVTKPVADSGPLAPRDSWRLGVVAYQDAQGRPVELSPAQCQVVMLGVPGRPELESTTECMLAAGVTEVSAQYHPNSRFWWFQLAELGVMVLLGGLSLGVGHRLLRRALR